MKPGIGIWHYEVRSDDGGTLRGATEDKIRVLVPEICRENRCMCCEINYSWPRITASHGAFLSDSCIEVTVWISCTFIYVDR